MHNQERTIFIPFVDAFGGAERLVLDLSRFLEERSISHSIVCFRQTINLQEYADWCPTVRQLLPSRNPMMEARTLSKYLGSRASTAFKPLLFDLKSGFYSGLASNGSFVLHLTDPPSLLPADVSKYSSKARRIYKSLPAKSVPTVVQRLRGELVHRCTARGMKRATKTIVMTEKTRSELRALYDVDAVLVRPGVSSRKSDRDRKATEIVRILSVSRLEATKRIDWVLRALASIEVSERSWFFEIIGKGPEEESLWKLATALGISDRVLFRGHVSDRELEEAYSKAGVFVMPAVQGYGLPALEALRRRVPTIVHRDSGVSEILNGSPWVEIIDGQNGSLTEAITAMLKRVGADQLDPSTIPRVPSSDEWAEEISNICGWL